MTSFPLVRTQLVPPRIKNLLKRQRLQALGQLILSHRVTTVIAPAGYGKSVWVSSLLEDQNWPLTAWLSLDQHDTEPSFLLYHLINAVKTVLPEFGSESLRTVTSLENTEREWSIAINTFMEEIPQEIELVLIFDDLHIIQGCAVSCTIIGHLLRWLPDTIHLVLISRSNPTLNLYHQLLSGDLLEIRSEQLLFSLEETRDLLSLMELKLAEKDILSLYTRTEGWAVGLRLAGMLIKQSVSNWNDTMQNLQQENSSLYKYLGNELLGSISVDFQDFLLDAALLPYLEVELCNAALQRTDSFAKIEQLHASGLLSRIEGQTTTWRMHHLIGEYLSDKAAKLRSPKYIASLRHHAGTFLEHKGDIDRALEQAVTCANWVTAADLIQKYGYDYFTINARLDALFKWIELLPKALVKGNHWLLYFKGKSILQIDDNEAVNLLSSSADLAGQKGDLKCEACSLLAMINAHILTGDMKKGKEVSQRLLANPSLLKDPISRGAALTVALGQAIFNDDLHQGLKLSRLALRLKLNPEITMSVLYGSAIINQRLGNLDYARQLVEKALAMPFVQENERWSVSGYEVLATILTLRGDTIAVEEICRKILHLGKKYNMLLELSRAHRQLARIYLREGRFNEARREMELAHNHFIEGNSVSFSYFIGLELMPMRIKTGEKAGELLEETLDLLNKLEASPVGQGSDYLAFSLAGIVALEAGEIDLARQLFEKSVTQWRRNGAKQNLAGTNLLLSHVYLLQGKENASNRLLRIAMGAAEAGQWKSFWEWHEETIYIMCWRSVLKNIHANWAAHLLCRWFPASSRQELAALFASSNQNYRILASSLFHQIYEENSTNVIYAFYLDRFRVFINGLEIPKQAWKTQRAENLFKFLVANKNYYPKEEIIGQLWPDSDYKSGEANLRMTLSYIRKAIGVHGPVQESVIMERGKVYLSPKIEVFTDYELFEMKTKKALRHVENNSPYAVPALEQALQLYRGDFLMEDIYDDWTNKIRTRLHALYLQLLLNLALAYYNQNNLSSALQACGEYLACEPVDENVNRLTMRILWQTRKKQKAISLYHKLETTLSSEYDTVPESETIDLYKKICAGKN